MSKLMKECLFTPQQIVATETLDQINKIIGEMDHYNDEIGQDIDYIEKEMIRAYDDVQNHKGPLIPGKKIQEFVQHWDEMLMKNEYSNEEIIQYGTEFSKSLKEFEAELRGMETCQKIEMKRQK